MKENEELIRQNDDEPENEEKKKPVPFNQLLAAAKNDIYGQIGEIKNVLVPGLTDDQLYLQTDPAITTDLDIMENDSLLYKAFADDSGDIETGEKMMLPSEARELTLTRDKGASKALKKKLGTFLNEADTTLHSQFYDENDEASSELALGFIKASVLGPMKRMLDGQTKSYLALKTPLVDAVGGMVGTVNGKLDKDLPKRLAANEKFYPLVSMINGGERYLQTLSDYWKEKEEAGGKMEPARNKQYRQSLYDQAKALLPLIDKMSEAAKDEASRQKIAQSGLHSSGNPDPFHNALESSRGALQLKCSLQAYEAGLKNGWDIDDIGTLATFNYILACSKNACKGLNTSETIEGYRANMKKEPEYREGEKDFLERMQATYDRLSRNQLSNAEERTKALNEMKQLVDEGLKAGFIDNTKSRYFDQVLDGALSRNKAIEKGTEPAVYDPASVSEDYSAINEIDMSMYKFASKRSIIFLGRESKEHKDLRIAVEELEDLELKKKNPLLKEQYSDEKYLAKLDEIIYRSRIYQKEKAGADTSAGKKRLEGAKKYEAFAKQARKAIIDRKNAEKPDNEKELTLKELRINNAVAAANKAGEEMGKMNSIPAGAGKRQFIEYAADILVGKFASSNSEPLQEGFLIKGANVLKKELLASKEFNRMISSYVRERKAIPDIVQELSSEAGMNKLRSMSEKIRQEARAKKAKSLDVQNTIRNKNNAAQLKR